MTSYRVVAPILLARFQGSDGVFFRAWSPRRYGPAYTYDLIIEAEDDQHPAMNIEYTGVLRKVLQQLQGVLESPLVDMTTDFHCPTPVEERGDEGFIVTFRDGPFSPVFFLREDAVLYQAYLQEELGLPSLTENIPVIRSFPHERI